MRTDATVGRREGLVDGAVRACAGQGCRGSGNGRRGGGPGRTARRGGADGVGRLALARYRVGAPAAVRGFPFRSQRLETKIDPPDLDGARDWYQRAADAGNTDAMLSLGSLNLRGFDVEGAARAWQPILEDGPSELAAVASVNLAPIFAVTGQLIQAVATLQVAAVFGAQQQGRCIAVRLVR